MSEKGLGELPKGWEWKVLRECTTRITDGTHQPPKFTETGVPFLFVRHIVDGTISFEGTRFISEQTYQELNRRCPVETGDVLYSAVGSYGVAVPVRGATRFSFQRHIAHIKPSTLLSNDFLAYFLNSPLGQNQAHQHARGVAQKTVTLGSLSTFIVPVTSQQEQARTVFEIEKHFTRLDAAESALRQAQTKLKRQRAAVLKAACEGRLSSSLTATSSASKEPSRGWRLVLVSEAGMVQLGRQRAPQHHAGPHMRPYLRVANVFEDRISTSDVLEMNFSPSEYETYKLEYGDILLNEGQSLEWVGRPAMYRDEVPGACFQNTLVRFRAKDHVAPKWALLVFRAYLHSQQFQKIAKWTTNIAHLGAERFANMHFPLPPLEEQHRIVAEVDRRLSTIEAMEAQVDKELLRSKKLRQAILKRAFEGKLVPQDPSEEPASVLLERIRTGVPEPVVEETPEPKPARKQRAARPAPRRAAPSTQLALDLSPKRKTTRKSRA